MASQEPVPSPPQVAVDKRTLDSYEKDVDSTGKAVLAWAVTLALTFTAIVNSLAPKLHDIQRIEAKRQGAIREERRFILERERLRTGPSSNDADLTKRIKEIADANEERRRSTTKQFVDLRRELGSVPTPLGAVTLPLRYMPTAWLALSCGLLLFVSAKRRRHLKQLASMSLTQTNAGASPATLCVSGPLWCAPLPRRVYATNADVPASRRDLASAVGWPDQGEARAYAIVGAIATSAFVWQWMAQYAIVLSRYDSDPLVQFKLRVLVVGLSLIAVMLAVQWFSAIAPASLNAARAFGASRRAWLRTTAIFTAGAGAYFAAPRWLLPAFLRRDGRRIRIARGQQSPAPSAYRGKFLMHPKSRVVHYIDSAGWHSEKTELNLAAMVPVAREVVIELASRAVQDREVTHFPKEPVGARPLSAGGQARGASSPERRERRASRSALGPRRLHSSQLYGVAECLALQMVLDGRRQAAFNLLAGLLATSLPVYGIHPRQSEARLLDLAVRIGSSDQAQIATMLMMRQRMAAAERRGQNRTTTPVKPRQPPRAWHTPYARSRGFAGLVAAETIEV